MKFIQWLKYRDIKDYRIRDLDYLIDNEKHWFNPYSIDDEIIKPDGFVYYDLNGDMITEAISHEFKNKGGVIVFSTDVNASNLSKSNDSRLMKSKVVQWFKRNYKTFINRLMRNKKIVDVVRNFDEIKGFSVGNFFKGRYIEGDNVYNEKSLSIEVIGMPSEVLVRLATEIARDFEQKEVLLKDYNKNKFMFIDRR